MFEQLRPPLFFVKALEMQWHRQLTKNVISFIHTVVSQISLSPNSYNSLIFKVYYAIFCVVVTLLIK